MGVVSRFLRRPAAPTVFYKLVPDLVREMGSAYPQIKEQQTRIMQTLRDEETRFGQTLETGLALFDDVLSGMEFLKLAAAAAGRTRPAADAENRRRRGVLRRCAP